MLTVADSMTTQPPTLNPMLVWQPRGSRWQNSLSPTSRSLYLQQHRLGCLPVVVVDGQLTGIASDAAFMALTIDLLEQTRPGEPEEPGSTGTAACQA